MIRAVRSESVSVQLYSLRKAALSAFHSHPCFFDGSNLLYQDTFTLIGHLRTSQVPPN